MDEELEEVREPSRLDAEDFQMMLQLAAAGGNIAMSGLDPEEGQLTRKTLIYYAPLEICDDMQKVCSYFTYRYLLMKAVENNDLGQIYTLNNSIESLVNG